MGAGDELLGLLDDALRFGDGSAEGAEALVDALDHVVRGSDGFAGADEEFVDFNASLRAAHGLFYVLQGGQDAGAVTTGLSSLDWLPRWEWAWREAWARGN